MAGGFDLQPQAAIGEQLEALENSGPILDVCLRPQFVLLSPGHCAAWTTEFLKFVQGYLVLRCWSVLWAIPTVIV